MNSAFNISLGFYLVGIVFCLLTAALLWRYTGQHQRSGRHLLVLYFFACSFGNFIVFLVYSGTVQFSPWYHLFRTGNIVGLMIMPISFLYFRTVMKQRQLKATDLLHFLPSVLYTIDYLPVFLLPASEKMIIAKIEMAMADRGQSIQHGWITPAIDWILVRTILMTIYWIVEARMLYATTRLVGSSSLIKENRSLFNWLILTAGIQALYFVPFYVNMLFGSNPYNFVVIHTSISVSVFAQMVILLFKPGILYGLKGVIIPNHAPSHSNGPPVNTQTTETSPVTVATGYQSEAGDRRRPEYLSEETVEAITRAIAHALLDNRAYLKKGYSMRDLSIATGYQSYLLSAVINQVYKQRFNDFINSQRIKYACESIKAGSDKTLTLQAIAEECGFNNRNSFTTAFKKHAGYTPSEYARANSGANL